eukprot:NODE_2329_length_955_cov_193.263333.p1 GENE.NODE_2329_length_955_cov_193.263333~~NODE_2329_length_955_cov_193.263333.p1  ORF type:complete len:277 (-),score=76.35 NODE_2329_length_955_cov_193.263333:107-937(-)
MGSGKPRKLRPMALRQIVRSAAPARVALIHAMQPSIAATLPAFERHWPEAELVNILDDSLARDVGHTGLDNAMTRRFVELARYARDQAHCDAALFTCSAFGSAIEAAQKELRTEAFPVLKPNEAMMEEAVALGRGGGGAVAVLSMFEPTLGSITREMRELPDGAELVLRPRFVPDAMDALTAGDEARCIELIAAAVAKAVEEEAPEPLACVALAMFSMARGREAAETRLSRAAESRGGAPPPPVLSSPESAVLRLRAHCEMWRAGRAAARPVGQRA